MIDLCRKCRRLLEHRLREARKFGIDLSWFCKACRRKLVQELEQQ